MTIEPVEQPTPKTPDIFISPQHQYKDPLKQPSPSRPPRPTGSPAVPGRPVPVTPLVKPVEQKPYPPQNWPPAPTFKPSGKPPPPPKPF